MTEEKARRERAGSIVHEFGREIPLEKAKELAPKLIKLQEESVGRVFPKSIEEMEELLQKGRVAFITDHLDNRAVALGIVEPIDEEKDLHVFSDSVVEDRRWAMLGIFDQIRRARKDKTILAMTQAELTGRKEEVVLKYFKAKKYTIEEFLETEYADAFINGYLNKIVANLNQRNREEGLPEISVEQFIQDCIDDNFLIFIQEKEEDK